MGRIRRICTTCTHLAVIANAVLTHSRAIAAPAKSHAVRCAFHDDGRSGTMTYALIFGKALLPASLP
ncbi:hypothetical protein [Desulfogranum japonicum]|uniref:hypothetical protein n=1 Tax=Desulfogranum japonicum TaxID=231447 RepID=UPI0012947145|nr:hypothetical protein [Desulfogranum japonicum]